MKHLTYLIALLVFFSACKEDPKVIVAEENESHSTDLIIAFGSCNRQNIENPLWDDVLKNNPSHWIWGGDNIYADTDDMAVMQGYYEEQMKQPNYSNIVLNLEIHGTWDDHDYGLNDGGVEFEQKAESQKLLLDFLGVPANDERRAREGAYYSHNIVKSNGTVKLLVLDTRYFRTALTESENPDFRYDPNPYGEGTMLGEAQWQWLENELKTSQADFNLIVSSIQFLSGEHGYESWSTMPHEIDKFKEVVTSSNAKGVLILSGDRHISEFSKIELESLDYPLIDFTSSGMTHSYSSFESEPNKYRTGEVVSNKSFGLLKFHFENKKVVMQMRGNDNILQQELIQQY